MFSVIFLVIVLINMAQALQERKEMIKNSRIFMSTLDGIFILFNGCARVCVRCMSIHIHEGSFYLFFFLLGYNTTVLLRELLGRCSFPDQGYLVSILRTCYECLRELLRGWGVVRSISRATQRRRLQRRNKGGFASYKNVSSCFIRVLIRCMRDRPSTCASPCPFPCLCSCVFRRVRVRVFCMRIRTFIRE